MQRRLLFISLLLVMALFAVQPAAAQEPVEARLLAPAGHWTVGDPVPLALAVSHPAGYQVIPPALGPEWDALAVQSLSPGTTVANGDGAETTSFVIDVRLFSPGDIVTPAVAVSVTDGAGHVTQSIAAPVSLTIGSVLADGDTALRDLKPQAVLPLPQLWPWLAAGLALAGAGLWRWRQRLALMAQTSDRAAASDNRLPHEWALDELARIEGLDLPAQGRFKEHYTGTSDTVRLYIERVYGIPMLERATFEVRSGVNEVGLPADVTVQLLALLEASDLVKFSELAPEPEDARLILAQARFIVEATRPQPLEPVAEGNRRGPTGAGPSVRRPARDVPAAEVMV